MSESTHTIAQRIPTRTTSSRHLQKSKDPLSEHTHSTHTKTRTRRLEGALARRSRERENQRTPGFWHRIHVCLCGGVCVRDTTAKVDRNRNTGSSSSNSSPVQSSPGPPPPRGSRIPERTVPTGATGSSLQFRRLKCPGARSVMCRLITS